ncbi:MAG: RNA polymerase sigma-70 factor [Prolixibacteraceae bacterium]|nr:RNA polymerase sigma-70 factor [Prolixibacteraceae bacterium]
MNQKLETIFHQYYSPLCNYASAIINDYTDAEDIVQTFFIQLYERRKLPEIANIEAYLLRSIRFKCIDYLRNKKRKNTISIQEIDYLEHTLPNEITEQEIEPLFHYYAAKLPPKTRTVFLLSRVNKLTYREIAEELNLSQKTVENQMGSALKKMKVILKEEHYFLLLF